MRLEEQRWIDKPQDEVFRFTADFSNIAAWDPGVTRSRRLDEGPLGEGSRFYVEVKFGSSTMPMTYEIVEYEENKRVVLYGFSEKLEAVDEITFETHDNMTLVGYTADLTFHNFVRYLGPVVAPMMRKVGEKALDGLAEVFEEIETTKK
jgi:uncharacterized protein YndB with AHSA1/START domain